METKAQKGKSQNHTSKTHPYNAPTKVFQAKHRLNKISFQAMNLMLQTTKHPIDLLKNFQETSMLQEPLHILVIG